MTESLRHSFVEFIPDDLETGVIYVSIAYATAVHTCACGCGEEVVTPLSPTDWTLLFDGNSISLDPSIGNWSFACRSHYWVRRGQVVSAPQWSKREIAAGRAYDQENKRRYFGLDATPPEADVRKSEEDRGAVSSNGGLWERLKGVLRS